MYNFNNVIDARGSLVGMLQRIYGQNNYLLWEKPSESDEFTYGKDITIDPTMYDKPFTVKMHENGTITYKYAYNKNVANANIGFIRYKINSNNWITPTINDYTIDSTSNVNYGYVSFTLNANYNDEVSFGIPVENDGGLIFHTRESINVRSNNQNNFLINGRCSVYGNLLSLVFYDDWTQYQNHIAYCCMAGLFWYSDITDASQLVIPQLYADRAYESMFNSNIYLVNPPRIEDISLAVTHSDVGYEYMFSRMFYGCESLVDIPKLPKMYSSNINFGTFNFSYMFAGCTLLKTNIILEFYVRESIIKNYSFGPGMFNGCSRMRKVKILTVNSTYLNTYISRWLTGLFSGIGDNGELVKQSFVTLDRNTISLPNTWTISNE